jgi:hypothetical protein
MEVYSWENQLSYGFNGYIPGLVNVYKKTMGKSPFFIGKSTIPMAIFNSYFDIARG